ncbi:DUF6746 family protein [Methylophaga sp. OBS3]|uniref:DUF6746 family protein n=1 Tax=Methylophaga sp. OBS3 TaxID=2991934 RepID=UPI0022560EA2|nr:DUF6746 family protein [Methylophaga sp. OBS3]MCX4189779.1 hypothetical protein [Methylophaga sp. OBS3]
MKFIHSVAAAILSFGVVTLSYADPVEHFQGKPAENLAEAVNNFNAGNQRLAKLMDKESLTAADVAAIHKLTYTLENALAKINADLDQLAVTLEAIHLGSEEGDVEKVSVETTKYLAVTNDLSGLK